MWHYLLIGFGFGLVVAGWAVFIVSKKGRRAK